MPGEVAYNVITDVATNAFVAGPVWLIASALPSLRNCTPRFVSQTPCVEVMGSVIAPFQNSSACSEVSEASP